MSARGAYYDDGSEFEFPDDEGAEDMDFAEPGGTSALRAATSDNPRNLPCPTCGAPDRLTPRDVDLGYQCNGCADAAERGW